MSLSYKVLGAIGLASYAAAYVCVKLRHVSYHRVKLVAIRAEGLPAMPRGYSARMLSAAELAEHHIDIGTEAQAKRFAAGLECLGTFDGMDSLAGIVWLAKRSHHDDLLNVCFELPGDATWDTGMWVPEDKRMGRAFSAIWAGIGEWMSREGLVVTISCIADYNIPSILSHRRLGSRKLGYVVVLRIGSLQITLGARPIFHRDGAPGLPTVRLSLASDHDNAAESLVGC